MVLGAKLLNIASHFDYMRRFLGTLFGFLLFGMVGLLFKIILLPFTLKSARNHLSKQRQARRLISAIWRFFVRYLIFAGVLSLSLKGFERLGKPGQLILANHPSLLDVVFLIAYVRELNCVVKKDLLRNPVMKSPILACGFLPNDESEAVLESVDAILQNGQSLLIFPEGTRTGWDGQIDLHRGAVSMGLRSARIITPVVIKMNPPNFKKGQAWYKIPKMKVVYELVVGEDIDPHVWLAEKPLPIASRRLNDYLQNYFMKETTT